VDNEDRTWREVAPHGSNGSILVDGLQPWPQPHRQPLGVGSTGRKARVLIAIGDLGFHQEVLDFLERDPRIDVVAAVAQPEAFFRIETKTSPDVVIACPVLTREIQHPAGSARRTLLIVGQEMTVSLLRDAIDAGAKGVFSWPEERDELAQAISARSDRDEPPTSPRGRVVAVFGARGGSGTTFIASHLAAALSDLGRRCVLVDLDACFADVSVALGIAPDQAVRTIADLIPVAAELQHAHVEDALFRHERGFAGLLAPPEAASREEISPGLYGGVVSLLSHSHDVVVVHVPRRLDATARVGLDMADQVFLVVSPDLFSLYAARRAMAAIELRDVNERCRVVLNPLTRGEIRFRDIEQIIGIRPAAAVRFDPAVGRAQGRGELLRGRSHRAWRDVQDVARLVLATESGGNAGEGEGS
jgi:pilus assembly protein CpaE